MSSGTPASRAAAAIARIVRRENIRTLCIGELVAGLVEDGSTLQMGIGGIPDAVLSRLHHKRDLGIHTEMLADGLIELCQAGLVTGARKRTHPGKLVFTFAGGSAEQYRFIHNNPMRIERGSRFSQLSFLNSPGTGDYSNGFAFFIKVCFS